MSNGGSIVGEIIDAAGEAAEAAIDRAGDVIEERFKAAGDFAQDAIVRVIGDNGVDDIAGEVARRIGSTVNGTADEIAEMIAETLQEYADIINNLGNGILNLEGSSLESIFVDDSVPVLNSGVDVSESTLLNFAGEVSESVLDIVGEGAETQFDISDALDDFVSDFIEILTEVEGLNELKDIVVKELGDLDNIVSKELEELESFANTELEKLEDEFAELLSPTTGSGGQNKFSITSGEGTTIVTDFGGVGTGIEPSQAVVDEVDTLQFTGPDLTAENLLLTQNGSDLEITFEGVENTKVILRNFALEDLDNLETIGNISFDGDLEIQDSFDVINTNQRLSRVFNRDTVTFLNDLDNRTEGFNQSDDVINGQGGDDTLSGLSGNDLLRGGSSSDLLDGGDGNDILSGGPGNDIFNYDAAFGGSFDRDIIQDFEKGSDQIKLVSFGLTFDTLNLSIIGNNTVIDLSSTFGNPPKTDTITVADVTNLGSSDFNFLG